MTDTDSMIAISQRMDELRSVIARLSGERDQLQAKLDEHELLFSVAVGVDDFLQKLLDGLGHQLPPGTPRTVEGIVDAVATMALKLDAHEDASTPAFDEIAKLCGCPQWDYPGQIVRDVERLVQERDFWKSQTNALTPAYVTMQEKLALAEKVRDDARAASQRYLDEKRGLEAELRTEKLSEAAQSKAGTAFAYSVESRIRELTEQKNGAYDERDRCVAGLAALAVRLGWSAWLGRHEPDPKWDQDWMTIVFINLPTGQVSWHIHDSEVEWFSFLPKILERPWDGHTTEQKYKRLAALGGRVEPYPSNLDEHIRRAAEDALRPDSPASIAYDRVYEVMGNEGTADERMELYWRTLREVRDGTFKPTLGEPSNPVTTEPSGPTLGGECFVGKSPEERRAMIEAVVMGESEHDQYDRATGEFGTPMHQTQPCSCSPKYRELAPGVHAAYCALGGLPLDSYRVKAP